MARSCSSSALEATNQASSVLKDYASITKAESSSPSPTIIDCNHSLTKAITPSLAHVVSCPSPRHARVLVDPTISPLRGMPSPSIDTRLTCRETCPTQREPPRRIIINKPSLSPSSRAVRVWPRPRRPDHRESVAWSRPSIPPFLRTNNNSDSASLALSAISVSSTHQPHQHTTHRAPPASRARAGDYGRRANDGHEICGFPFQALWASLLGSPHDFVGHAKIKALPRVLSLFTPLP